MQPVDPDGRLVQLFFLKNLGQALKKIIAQADVAGPRSFLGPHRLEARFDQQNRRLPRVAKKDQDQRNIDVGKVGQVTERRAVAAHGAGTARDQRIDALLGHLAAHSSKAGLFFLGREKHGAVPSKKSPGRQG